MHIVRWYGSGDAVQVSRSQAEYALSPDHRDSMSRLCVWGSWTTKRRQSSDSRLLREQAPYSQHNGYSLRRDLCSFDSTFQDGNRMTICSSVHGTCVCGINVYGPHNGLEYARRKSVVLLTLA